MSDAAREVADDEELLRRYDEAMDARREGRLRLFTSMDDYRKHVSAQS